VGCRIGLPGALWSSSQLGGVCALVLGVYPLSGGFPKVLVAEVHVAVSNRYHLVPADLDRRPRLWTTVLDRDCGPLSWTEIVDHCPGDVGGPECDRQRHSNGPRNKGVVGAQIGKADLYPLVLNERAWIAGVLDPEGVVEAPVGV